MTMIRLPVWLMLVWTVLGLLQCGTSWSTEDRHYMEKRDTLDSDIASINSSVVAALSEKVEANSTVIVNGSTEICSTDLCHRTAERMLAVANISADPCDDFYYYACGNYLDLTPIPSDTSIISQIKSLTTSTNLKVQDMLAKSKSDMFASEIKAKNMFQQCKDQDSIENMGAKPLLALLNEAIGGWPVITSTWNASQFDLFKALIKLKEHGDEPLFKMFLEKDMANPSSGQADNVITLEEPDTFASKDVLVSDAGDLQTESYLTYTVNVTTLLMAELGDKRSVDDLADQLTDQLDLGRFISMSGLTGVQKRDLTYRTNKTALGLYQSRVFVKSSLFRQMTDLFKAFFDLVGLGSNITSQTTIVVRSPDFFRLIDDKLFELEKLGPDGIQRIANYIGWRIIDKNIATLSQPYRDARARHSERISGRKASKVKSAEERCAADVLAAFPLAVGAVYVRDNVPSELKPKVTMMMADLKLGFKELLTDAAWMDNKTITAALRKLDTMLDVIGYPDVMVNNISAIDAAYDDISSIGTTYFDTLQSGYRWKTLKNLRKLTNKNKRYDPIDDAIDVTQVNAENFIEKNFVYIYAGILQRPFYETRNPQYLNYGGVGFGIGHEITHSFDDQGALIDNNGFMRKWWSNDTTAAYNIRKQGFVDQYNSFKMPVGHINGELTLSENIADNGGLKAAYRAYFNHYQKRLSTPEPLLPLFPNTTAEQLFFLATGQAWCGKVRPAGEQLLLLQDVHSPFRFRIVGPMLNLPEFSEAYNCPVGSRMNPSVKRAVW